MLLYLFFGLVFFAVSLGIGSIVAPLLINYDFESKGNILLFKVLLGLLFICSSYAILKTHFNTVFILIFVAGILIAKQQRIKYSLEFANYKHVGIFCLYLILTFGWQFYYQYREAFIFNHDQIYYSMLSNMLSTNGVETVYTHPILKLGFHGNAPYHYLEIWLTAFLKTIFLAPADYTFVFVVIPFFSALSCYAIHVNFGSKLYLNIFCKALLFFTILHCIPFTQKIFFWIPKLAPLIKSITVSPFLSAVSFKLLIALPIIVYLFSLKDSIDKKKLIVFTYILLIANFAVGLCFWLSLGVYLIYDSFIRRKYLKTDFAYYIGLSFLYGAFYFFTGSKIYNNLNFWSSLLGDFQGLKTRINIVGGVGLCVLMITLFYLLVFKVLAKKFLIPERTSLIFILLVVAAGTGLWALFFHIVDAVQFCNNSLIIIHILCWFVSVTYLIQAQNYPAMAILFVWWVFMAFLPLLKSPEKEKVTLFEKQDISNRLSQIGFTASDSNFIKSDPFVNNSTLNFNLYYAYSRPESYYTCAPEMLFKRHSKNKLDSSHQVQRQMEDLLVYYKLKLPQGNMSDDQTILSFAKKYKVNHIYLKPGEQVPEILRSFVYDKIKIGQNDSLIFFKIP